MCGIYLTNIPLEKEKLEIKLNGIAHRGPDFTGVLQQDNLSFGHTRLSILDLDSRSNQPMIHEDYILVFNGEIYNYKTIKKELQDLGENFSTQGDSEVLLVGYKRWGKALVPKLNGMFAFSIYDKKNNEVFSARDRLGVKPFYYSWDKGVFEICSQIKPLSEGKTLDQEAIEIYLQTGYVPSPWSIYKEVKKLKPGFTMTMSLTNQEIDFEQYWELQTPQQTYLSYEEAKEKLHELLKDAVKIRLQSDVPYGSFLSGGIDSALVSAIANKAEKGNLRTFTIGFDNPEYDESLLANKFSEIIGSNHQETICSANDLIDLFPTFFKTYGEPFADSSAIPSLLLNKTTKPQVTVALSGDGGDESFLGYNHFDWLTKISVFFKTPYFFRRLISIVLPFQWLGKRGLGIKNIFKYKTFDDFTEGIFTGFGPLLLKHKNVGWLKEFKQFRTLSSQPLQRTADLNIKLWLENDSNVKVDRASMAFGVEVRSPFLDYRVIEFARTLPVSYRFHNGKRKRILRDILNEYIPESVFDVPKKGFAIPLAVWIRNELKEDIQLHLTDEFFETIEGLNVKTVKKFMRLHFTNKGDYSAYIWRVYVLAKWFKNNPIEN
ncbi:asparagine synthase (glutamine-hydrolyzing) [Flavobacteriaceae bacterium]|nr:asparagine synthase (glutamine-hydrolyzing) [Flavobacteriaceae bacterium]